MIATYEKIESGPGWYKIRNTVTGEIKTRFKLPNTSTKTKTKTEEVNNPRWNRL